MEDLNFRKGDAKTDVFGSEDVYKRQHRNNVARNFSKKIRNFNKEYCQEEMSSHK